MGKKKNTEMLFEQRLDFYWKSIALYSTVLIIYSLIRGSISDGKFMLVLLDPFVILLTLFIAFTGVSLIFKILNSKRIIIGNDFIEFNTNSRQKKYTLNDIDRILIQKQRILKVPAAMPLIKIKIKNRIRILKIRPNSFYNEEELIEKIKLLHDNLKHK